VKTTSKLLLVSLLFPLSVLAADSNSTSSAVTGSNAAAQNAGNAQSITFTSPESSTVRTTGNATLPGFSGSFSSDYCGSTAGVAGGGVGFAISAGAPKIDNTCVMLRVFERTQQAAASLDRVDAAQAQLLRTASLEVLAETDPKVKEIFQKRNLIPQDAATLSAPAPVSTGSIPAGQ